MNKKQVEKLLESFDIQKKISPSAQDNHLAACAIFESVFSRNLDKWNAPQDKKWVSKYNRALLALADNGRIVLCAKN